jgi:hypothetical protein
MPKLSQSRRVSINPYYAAAAVLVAASSAMAVFASIAPGQMAWLTKSLDAEMALFIVPLCVLLFAVIAETLHIGARKPGQTEQLVPARIRPWTKDHE